MTPAEVTELLMKSKIYIDFGHHPGMDRLPREAALAGCIVVTNKEGAANFRSDVPIGEEWKVRKFDVDAVHELLKKGLGEYEGKAAEFGAYREWIYDQEKVMNFMVERIAERLGNPMWEKEEGGDERERLLVKIQKLEAEAAKRA